MKNYNLIFLALLLFGSVLLANCGVKRPPSPAYSTGLPFEEESDYYYIKPSPSPSASPSASPGLKTR